MSDNLIITHVVTSMKDAQQLYDNSIDKKKFVMKQLKQYLGNEKYTQYEPIISIMIDFIKHIVKDKSILKGFYTSKCYISLFNSCK